MPTFISRLELVNGQTVQIGHPWPGEVGSWVTIIVERLEVEATIHVEEDGEPEEPAVEKTPAQYEVWLLPEELFKTLYEFFNRAFAGAPVAPEALLQQLNAVKDAPCRRVFAKGVLFVEEVWPMQEAYPQIQEYFSEKLQSASVAEPAPPAPARPRLPASLNGPQQQGG